MPSLFPYQMAGAAKAASKSRFLIADEMGLGKSAQAIAAADLLDAKNVQVICPAGLCVNWVREFEKFGLKKRFLRVSSYENATKHYEDILALMPDLIILDEVHYLKNMKAKRTKIIYGKIIQNGNPKNVIALSGTPMPNMPDELWTLMFYLFPDSLRPAYGKTDSGAPWGFWSFQRKFCVMKHNGFGLKVTGGKALPELRARLAPNMIRRKKVDVLQDLPAMILDELYMVNDDNPDDQLGEHEKKALRVAIDTNTLEAQAGSFAGYRKLIGMAKVAPIVEFLKNELGGNDEKIVLFAHHRDVIESLRHNLKEFNPCVVYGGLSDVTRQIAIDQFQNDPARRVFIGQFQAAGEGITLTAASDVIFVESSWTPKDLSQAANRCHRIGQKSSVLVRFATLAGSLDEDIQKALRRKVQTINQLF